MIGEVFLECSARRHFFIFDVTWLPSNTSGQDKERGKINIHSGQNMHAVFGLYQETFRFLQNFKGANNNSSLFMLKSQNLGFIKKSVTQ